MLDMSRENSAWHNARYFRKYTCITTRTSHVTDTTPRHRQRRGHSTHDWSVRLRGQTTERYHTVRAHQAASDRMLHAPSTARHDPTRHRPHQAEHPTAPGTQHHPSTACIDHTNRHIKEHHYFRRPDPQLGICNLGYASRRQRRWRRRSRRR